MILMRRQLLRRRWTCQKLKIGEKYEHYLNLLYFVSGYGVVTNNLKDDPKYDDNIKNRKRKMIN